MTVIDRLSALVSLLPADGAVTLPVQAVREWIEADAKAGGRIDAASSTPVDSSSDRLISADAVAEVLGCSRRYVYAHRHKFPFAKELPGGTVRFSERGLQRWMQKR